MKFKYDIAVSFAGEDRSIVEKFVNALAANHISVFYDSWEQAQLWGKDLYQHLDMIYQQAAQYCVIFISENYVKKAWTTIAYIDLRHTSIQEIVSLLSEKLGVAQRPNVEEISKLITKGNTDDRLSAISKIAIFNIKDLLDTTIDAMLHDLSPLVRERAAWALDNLNDERALSALITAIHDENFGVRSAAGWGLVHLGDRVIPYMQEIIEKDENADAKQMARLVLENL